MTNYYMNYPWNHECFVEDLFLGGQWSIILGYRRYLSYGLTVRPCAPIFSIFFVLQEVIKQISSLNSLAYALILFINRISFLFSFSFYTFNILLVLFVIAGECPQLLFLYLQTNGIACLAHWSFSFRIIYINIEYIIKEIAGRLCLTISNII